MSQLHGMTTKVVESFYQSLDCPRALTCWLLFKNSEHEQLVNLETNPDHYYDQNAFRDAYLATKFLSKSTFLQTGINLKEVAMGKFFEAEEKCKEINLRGYHHMTVNSHIGARLHVAILRQIDTILGDFPLDRWFDSSGWGPGVTLLIKGKDTGPVNKFRCENGTTRPLDDLMSDFYALAYPSWDLSSRKIFKGNKVVTVPKNSKTDRTIAVEPGLNLWFQKGIGALIRRRLLRFGVDLDSQERNQLLAREGSITGRLATVDFSSASDTIARSTVRELIPNRWLFLMEATRSPYGVFGKNEFQYEKFSSMGNGFTFELESLIFYAIAVAVCEKLQLDRNDISVYGDDVIIPVRAFPLFVSTCEFYGFTVNKTKSFSSGYFRESCGAHWYNGLNCKPFFLKEEVSSVSRIYHTANSIRRLSRLDGFPGCDSRFYHLWRYLRRKVRNPCLIPEGYGDGGFIVNFDEARPSRARYGIEGYFTKHLADIPKVYQTDDHAVLLARLWARSKEMPLGNKVHLKRLVKQKVKRLFVRRWLDLGPWI